MGESLIGKDRGVTQGSAPHQGPDERRCYARCGGGPGFPGTAVVVVAGVETHVKRSDRANAFSRALPHSLRARLRQRGCTFSVRFGMTSSHALSLDGGPFVWKL